MIFFYLFVSLGFLLLHQTNMLRAIIINLTPLDEQLLDIVQFSGNLL